MENRNLWGRYILELFVVFLGVSTSFVLQNVRENNVERDMEMKYIEGFIEDVNENIDMLEEQISTDSSWIANNEYATSEVFNETLSLDSACSVFQGMATFSKFTQQNSTYSNIVNSGNLSLIKEYNLRQEIISFHKDLTDIELLEDYFHNHSQTNFIPYLISHFDVFDKKLTDSKNYITTEFKNLFGIHYSYSTQRLEEYRNLLEQAENLLVMLKERMEKKGLKSQSTPSPKSDSIPRQ